MSRPRSQGPSRCMLQWTLYMLLVFTAAVAMLLLVTARWPASIGAAVLLWRVIKSFRSLAGK
jgi:hypothetical protein